MQPHNPFFPKHTMCFKVGGASVNPMDTIITGKSSVDKWKKSVFNPSIDLQQTKNALSKGDFTTDAQLAAKEAEAAAAGNQPLPTTQSASQASLVNAQQDLLQREAAKKSIRKTIFAGETGGYKPAFASAASGMSAKAL